jgi:hypothetical protein
MISKVRAANHKPLAVKAGETCDGIFDQASKCKPAATVLG